MIYKELTMQPGEIFVNGERRQFVIVNFDSKWCRINLLDNGIPVEQHQVPTDCTVGRPFRTSGSQYKLLKQAHIALSKYDAIL